MNFSAELIQWYQHNKRDLPWRNTTDAYIIWLSEVILQQTRVDQGMPYFYRFAERFPTVSDFAAAGEDEVLRLWQGLGYYSRARNMLKTALMVKEQFGGKFPAQYDQLIKLKGIGEYTAAAIASFSANEAKAVVDGNVYRVLARYFGIDEPINGTKGKKTFQAIADEVLDKENAGLHNQAMMEFGALLCKPQNPACGICPVRAGCYAFIHKATTTLPVKLKKLKIRERFFNYFLITDGKKILLNKRGEGDIWTGMYDLPLIETENFIELKQLISLQQFTEFFGADNPVLETLSPKKQVLTHQHLFVRFVKLERFPTQLQPGWIFTEVINLKRLALPKVIFIFLDNFLN